MSMFIPMRGARRGSVVAFGAAFRKYLAGHPPKGPANQASQQNPADEHPDEVAKRIGTVEIAHHIGPLQRNQYASGGKTEGKSGKSENGSQNPPHP
jgi:hypothetical protein